MGYKLSGIKWHFHARRFNMCTIRASGVTFDICNASVEHNLIFVVGRYIEVCVNEHLEISDFKWIIKV